MQNYEWGLLNKKKNNQGKNGLTLLQSEGTLLKWVYYEHIDEELQSDTVHIFWLLPATCVFLAFAFPFQAFPLPAADEGWHGGIAVFSFCKRIHNIVVTCPDIWKCKI